MNDKLCDFCNEPGPTWQYPTRPFDFTVSGPVVTVTIMHGDAWMACDVCQRFIETRNADALLASAVSCHPMYRTLPRPIAEDLAKNTRLMHQQFFDHIEGEPTRMPQGVVN